MSSVVCSPDSRLAAISSFTDTIDIIDAQTRVLVKKIRPLLPSEVPISSGGEQGDFTYVEVHSNPVRWSSDGEELITTTSTAAYESYGGSMTHLSLQRWNVSAGRMTSYIKLRDSRNPFRLQSTVSPDGGLIAVADHLQGPGADSSAMSVELWDARTGARRNGVAVKPAGRSIVWSPDGRTIAAILGRQVKLIDVATLEVTASLPEHLPPIYEPTPDPAAPPVSTQPGTLVPAPVNTAHPPPGPVPTFPPPGYTPPTTPAALLPPADLNDYKDVSRITWSPDGATIATYDSSHIRFWDAASGKLKAIARHPDTCYGCGFEPGPDFGWSADARLFATLGKESEASVLRLWDGKTGAPLREVTTGVFSFRWSPTELVMFVERSEGRGLTREIWGINSSIPNSTKVP
jgi:WD40 repeat protein